MLQLYAWRFSRPVQFAPFTAAVPYIARARHSESAVTGDVGVHVLVLRTLIEEFGGEAALADLCRHMAAANLSSVGRNQTQSRASIRAALNELASCGALAIEDVNGTDGIARMAFDGIILAYGQPHSEILFRAV